jgi:hypothetical protein
MMENHEWAERFQFWRDIYLAAARSGNREPLQMADQALSDWDAQHQKDPPPWKEKRNERND